MSLLWAPRPPARPSIYRRVCEVLSFGSGRRYTGMGLYSPGIGWHALRSTYATLRDTFGRDGLQAAMGHIRQTIREVSGVGFWENETKELQTLLKKSTGQTEEVLRQRNELTEALQSIIALGGNLSDQAFLGATGPRDAAYRGGLFVEARRRARAAVAQPPEGEGR